MDLYEKFKPNFNDVNLKLPKLDPLPVKRDFYPNIKLPILDPLPIPMERSPNLNLNTLRLDPIPKVNDFNPSFKKPIPTIPRSDFPIPQLPPLPKPRVAKPQHSRESRLQFEKQIVSMDMPQFLFSQQGKNPSFNGWQKSTLIDMYFFLTLEIPPHYPDQIPNLYVGLPHTLPTFNSRTINEMGSSHAFHTIDNGPGGCVQICHFSSNSWDASKTCIAVLIKGIIWIEAYVVSYANEMTIAEVLDQWDWRQEW